MLPIYRRLKQFHIEDREFSKEKKKGSIADEKRASGTICQKKKKIPWEIFWAWMRKEEIVNCLIFSIFSNHEGPRIRCQIAL